VDWVGKGHGDIHVCCEGCGVYVWNGEAVLCIVQYIDISKYTLLSIFLIMNAYWVLVGKYGRW